MGRYDSSGVDGSDSHEGGFCKIVADRESKRIIGAQILGAQASEFITQLQPNIREGVTVKKLVEISESIPFFKLVISAAKKCVQALSARH